MANLTKIIFKNPLESIKGIFCLGRLALIILLVFHSIPFLAQARLEVKDAKKNFGFVKRGQVIKNEYEIKNVGTEPLIIQDVEIACSCTTVDFPKQPILPLQSATVVVNFNTTTVYGRQDRVVYLKSNGPKGLAKLRYKGVVLN